MLKISGDSMPVYMGNIALQQELSAIYDDQFLSTDLEANWHKEYYLAESNSKVFKDMQDPAKNKYQLYNFSSMQFKDRLFDAGIAKGTVGIATTNFWAWSDAVYLYEREYSGTYQTMSGKKIFMKPISVEVRNELISLYALILQERVISAIKHVDNGANGYAKYGLERLALGNDWPSIEREVYDTFPFMKEASDIDKKNLYLEVMYFFKMISSLFGKGRLDVFSNLNRMYQHYNGGKALLEPLSPIVKQSPFYEIIQISDQWRESLLESIVVETKVADDPF